MNMLLHPFEACLPLKRNYILNPQVFFSGTVAPTISCNREPQAPGTSTVPLPPAIVGQGAVGLRHLVHVMLPLNHRALVVKSLQQLMRQLLRHQRPPVLLLPALCDHPLHGQEAPPPLG